MNVANDQKVKVGDVIVKMPREASEEKILLVVYLVLLNYLKHVSPKDPAIISDIDGEVVFGGLHRGMRKITVVNGAESFDYFDSSW